MEQFGPHRLGSTGIPASEGMFLLGKHDYKAYEDGGLALDYYRVWNATWHDATKYFDPYTNINTTDLKLCNETQMFWPSIIANFLQFTADTEGVQEVVKG